MVEAYRSCCEEEEDAEENAEGGGWAGSGGVVGVVLGEGIWGGFLGGTGGLGGTGNWGIHMGLGHFEVGMIAITGCRIACGRAGTYTGCRYVIMHHKLRMKHK